MPVIRASPALGHLAVLHLPLTLARSRLCSVSKPMAAPIDYSFLDRNRCVSKNTTVS